MKILLIHQFFLADGEAGGSRFNDMTRVWALAGHEITVIADSTHYQSGGATEKEDSTHPNIDVIRIRTANYKGHKKLARIRSYNQFAIRASKRIRKLERHDIVIASSPSLPVVIPAIYAKKKWKIPFVFEVRDLWPESAISTGVVAASSMIAKSGVALEKMAYNTADHIVALSPGIQRDIEQQVETRVSLIPNGVHPNSIRHQAHASAASIEARVDLRTKFGWKEDEYILVYLGAHGIANCLQVLIEAAAILQEKGKFKIVCVGDGPMKNTWKKISENRNIKNIFWEDPISKSEVADLLSAANAGLAVLQRNATFTKVYPNKIFDYMAAGIPTICAIGGDASALIEKYNAGISVRPEYAMGIADAALVLSQNSQSFLHTTDVILENFNREELANKYISLLIEAVNVQQ